MLLAPHPALNQVIGVMLGMALAVGDMANAWQEQHLPSVRVRQRQAQGRAPRSSTPDARPTCRSDPATRDRDLIVAAQTGNTMAIQSLIAEGANLKARDAEGRTALIAAVYAHMGAAARLLIQAGADVNLQDNAQNSAFLLAAAQGDAETVRLALSHGANLRATNADGDTALIPAARRGYVEVVNELVKAGVPPDATNNLGLTALIEAVALGDGSEKYEKTAQILLDGGADPNLPDRGGITPMRHARQRGFHGIGALLFKARGH
ncbi:ankyrin repeat domain-containing protein [Ralstonia mannitolilytica]|uniref:ankyrin repeat domain-containing protein n=1 Tax=Ralstonia mannitolilytica TaxID=105219 RepID=UPI000C7D6FF5|nr:ankyrin repeat domain-containing protein [Ralstonia mannitolilytica]PLT17121.1 MFS transporter [Ralstonia mannitolilytica]